MSLDLKYGNSLLYFKFIHHLINFYFIHVFRFIALIFLHYSLFQFHFFINQKYFTYGIPEYYLDLAIIFQFSFHLYVFSFIYNFIDL